MTLKQVFIHVFLPLSLFKAVVRLAKSKLLKPTQEFVFFKKTGQTGPSHPADEKTRLGQNRSSCHPKNPNPSKPSLPLAFSFNHGHPPPPPRPPPLSTPRAGGQAAYAGVAAQYAAGTSSQLYGAYGAGTAAGYAAGGQYGGTAGAGGQQAYATGTGARLPPPSFFPAGLFPVGAVRVLWKAQPALRQRQAEHLKQQGIY